MDGGHVAHALASSLDGYVNKDAKFLDLFLLQETIARRASLFLLPTLARPFCRLHARRAALRNAARGAGRGGRAASALRRLTARAPRGGRKRGSHETLRKCKHNATQQAFAVKVVNCAHVDYREDRLLEEIHCLQLSHAANSNTQGGVEDITHFIDLFYSATNKEYHLVLELFSDTSGAQLPGCTLLKCEAPARVAVLRNPPAHSPMRCRPVRGGLQAVSGARHSVHGEGRLAGHSQHCYSRGHAARRGHLLWAAVLRHHRDGHEWLLQHPLDGPVSGAQLIAGLELVINGAHVGSQ